MLPLRSALPLVLALVAIGGCGRPGPRERAAQAPPPAPTEAEAKITLTVWDWHAADPSKGVGQWLSNIDREFEGYCPTIQIKHVGQSHDQYYEILKAAAANPTRGPDVVMLHQGMRVMDQRPSLITLSDYVTPDFRSRLVGWDLTCEGFDPAGVPLAVPIAVQGLVWYYNRSVLTEAGLNPDAPPQTWADFLAACDAVAQKGKAGIAMGEKEGFWGEWFVNSAYLQSFEDRDRDRLASGELSWTDPRAVGVLARLKELSDRGCFQKGATSTRLFPDAGEVFMRGEAAFFLGLISDVAHWKEFGGMIGPQNLGVMTCPLFDQGTNAGKFPVGGAFAYAVTRGSQHPAEAFSYIAFVANDAHANSFLSDVGSFPANQSYNRAYLTDPTAQTIAGWMSAGRTGRQLTEALPTSVGEALRRECQRLISGQTTELRAAEAIEKSAAAARKREARSK